MMTALTSHKTRKRWAARTSNASPRAEPRQLAGMALEDKLLLCSSLAVFGCVLAGGYVAEDTSAHRARCHQLDTCPSDHATYRWGASSGALREATWGPVAVVGCAAETSRGRSACQQRVSTIRQTVSIRGERRDVRYGLMTGFIASRRRESTARPGSTSWGSLVRAQYRPPHESPANAGLCVPGCITPASKTALKARSGTDLLKSFASGGNEADAGARGRPLTGLSPTAKADHYSDDEADHAAAEHPEEDEELANEVVRTGRRECDHTSEHEANHSANQGDYPRPCYVADPPFPERHGSLCRSSGWCRGLSRPLRASAPTQWVVVRFVQVIGRQRLIVRSPAVGRRPGRFSRSS